MDKKLFSKAWKTFNEDKVKLLNETDKALYFEVGNNSVFIKNDNGIYISCTCKFCTLTLDSKLCSNKIAIILWIATHNHLK